MFVATSLLGEDFRHFFHKIFIMILIRSLFRIILSRISVCHPGLVSRLTSPPTTGSAHFLRLRSERSAIFYTFTAAQWNLWQLHTFRIQIVISWIALSNVSQRLLPKWWNVSVFSILQVGALGNGKSACWGGGKAWAEVMIHMNITCTDFPIARAILLLNSSLDSSDRDIFSIQNTSISLCPQSWWR